MRYKAYKYRIYPNREQQQLINKHIGCCRYVYNLCLEKKINAYKDSKKSISSFELIKFLPALKKEQETSFLKEVKLNIQTFQYQTVRKLLISLLTVVFIFIEMIFLN